MRVYHILYSVGTNLIILLKLIKKFKKYDCLELYYTSMISRPCAASDLGACYILLICLFIYWIISNGISIWVGVYKQRKKIKSSTRYVSKGERSIKGNHTFSKIWNGLLIQDNHIYTMQINFIHKHMKLR